jgi:hypothetical protein
MGVPVLWVLYDPSWSRFDPYREWVPVVSPEDILNENHDFDFANPPENRGMHQETREKLINRIETFIEENKNIETKEEFIKTNYTEEERKEWQFNLMKTALDKWLRPSMDMVNELNKCKRRNKKINNNRLVKFIKSLKK